MPPKKEWKRVIPMEVEELDSSDDDEKIQAPLLRKPLPKTPTRGINNKRKWLLPNPPPLSLQLPPLPQPSQNDNQPRTEKQKEADLHAMQNVQRMANESNWKNNVSTVNKKKDQMKLENPRRRVAEMTGMLEANTKPEKKKSKKRRRSDSSSEDDSSLSSSDEELQIPRKNKAASQQPPPKRNVVFINH